MTEPPYDDGPPEPITLRFIWARTIVVELIVFSLGFWLGWEAAHWN